MFTIDRDETSKERETLIGEPTQEGVVTVPVADLKRLREQVTELQRRGTELVDENRRLRAELEGAKADLRAAWDDNDRLGAMAV